MFMNAVKNNLSQSLMKIRFVNRLTGMRAAEVKQLQESIEVADTDGDGKLDIQELRAKVLARLGTRVSWK